MADIDVTTSAVKPAEPSSAPDTASTALIVNDSSGRKVVKKIVKRKRRPARPQVDPATFTSEPPPQTGTTFNIWYNKWSGGDREDKYLSQQAAKGRCNIARDSGYTRADKVPGSYFCLFFARGICPKGQDCEYLHRLPGIHDIFNPNVDCFGRDKFNDYRDDMGGVGSFMRQNRTLYCGRIHVTDDIEEIVARHFQEWGQIDRTRVLTNRGVAFITYTNEANSQFAKEAMAHQSLDNTEILNVRWATVDPNPAAQKREARQLEEQAAEAVRRALPEEFVAEIEGRDPEAKRRRKELDFGLEGYNAPDGVYYNQGKGLEAAQEKMLLEMERNEEREQDVEDGHEDGGIFTRSTIQALKGLNGHGIRMESKDAPAAASGPLVGYGSEDESD
ncbi:pre-mRNA-splicing factor cwc2 [Eremomyces bilateralis CBS 781.70]|uniref:Pre-mRNA-splicing factor CWC2 n=1 Tax=Eremomyces bilateralis CBS 781.70 TaxID=1392243 RepID=A0A6G1G535_9PEZI|nr:pre-mRNA-splicing factor cwc2 [Eremomyces bilateralis CBS 781.70]KAF1813187.1 pre-mRNA-splicing factor cwc2 [Eremomyces bilateralis CBS 781.70]